MKILNIFAELLIVFLLILLANLICLGVIVFAHKTVEKEIQERDAGFNARP